MMEKKRKLPYSMFALYIGMMEKRAWKLLYSILGLYRDNRKENGNYLAESEKFFVVAEGWEGGTELLKAWNHGV